MRILTGSKSWFSKYPDFNPHDTDYLEIVENPVNFKGLKYIRGPKECIFRWEKMEPMRIIKTILDIGKPLNISSILNKQFNEVLGINLTHIRLLRPLVDKLSETKHSYLRLIYYYFLKNKGFYLTDEQLDRVYTEYKKYRNYE